MKLQEPFTRKIHFEEPLGDRDQAVFLPHETFAAMYARYPESFVSDLVPRPDDGVAHSPQMERRPARDCADYERLAIPIAMHGDDVPITGIGKGWTSKMTVFSWCSLLALERHTQEKLFLIYAVFEKISHIQKHSHIYLGSPYHLMCSCSIYLYKPSEKPTRSISELPSAPQRHDEVLNI